MSDTVFFVEPIGFGDGIYGPFEDEIEASMFMDASEVLSDATHKIVPREPRTSAHRNPLSTVDYCGGVCDNAVTQYDGDVCMCCGRQWGDEDGACRNRHINGEIWPVLLDIEQGSPRAGYICKQCGAPSPLGIGYVDNTPGAAERSADVVACPCGYSSRPL